VAQRGTASGPESAGGYVGRNGEWPLLHIELQSTNRQDMALRMLGYSLAIHRQFRRFPQQVVLYVGKAPLRMKDRVTGPGLEFWSRMVDIRVLDGDDLIASRDVEDNVIAVLARLSDERTAVRRILQRISRRGSEQRAVAIDELTLLAGLRNMGKLIKREARHMPILDDIMDHDLYGPLLREGREKGRDEGRDLFLTLVAERFGPVPAKFKKQIASTPLTQLKRMVPRVMRATSLDQLLKPSTNGKSTVRARK